RMRAAAGNACRRTRCYKNRLSPRARIAYIATTSTQSSDVCTGFDGGRYRTPGRWQRKRKGVSTDALAVSSVRGLR
ncbi:hypothetical protein CA830_22895, partial [Burkholderia multivorans]